MKAKKDNDLKELVTHLSQNIAFLISDLLREPLKMQFSLENYLKFMQIELHIDIKPIQVSLRDNRDTVNVLKIKGGGGIGIQSGTSEAASGRPEAQEGFAKVKRAQRAYERGARTCLLVREGHLAEEPDKRNISDLLCKEWLT